MQYFDRPDSDLYSPFLDKQEKAILPILEKDATRLVKLISKILVSGGTSYQQSLEKELAKLMATIDLAASKDLISKENIQKEYSLLK